MREIKLSVNGKLITMPTFSTAMEILIKAGEMSEGTQKYEQNPVVGVLINGELKPFLFPAAFLQGFLKVEEN